MLIRFFVFFLLVSMLQAQGTLKFLVKNEGNKPVPNVRIEIFREQAKIKELTTDSLGKAQIRLPEGKYLITFYGENYNPQTKPVTVVDFVVKNLYVRMTADDVTLDEQVITDKQNTTELQENAFMEIIPLETKELKYLPSVKADVEAKLALLPGVSTSSEFSSQYSVRGGNYDENLIYINDIEIFRPQLVRSGQQEGLGITNSFLVGSILFGTGGFPAIYGDKMSSVLDVKYRTPERPRANLELGLITLNLNIENKIQKTDSSSVFTYQIGIRRFSMRYFLNSLQTKGSYLPSFWDVQTMLRYFPKKSHWDFSLFFIGRRNNYYFEPQSQETTFGTINKAFRLFVAYAGKEISRYTTGQTAVKIHYKPSYKFDINFISTYYTDLEEELADVEGGYRLGDVSTNFGNEDFNEVVFLRGIGTELVHRRNYLFGTIFSNKIQGHFIPASHLKHKILFGAEIRNEYVWDKFKEWEAIDSAEYLTMSFYIDAENTISNRSTIAYLQHNWKLAKKWKLQYGVRFQNRTINRNSFYSPRMQIVFNPSDSLHHFQLRASAGVYYQPPFYREMRDFQGNLNTQVKAQKSTHFILGGDYVFHIWDRPFKFFSEVYYKKLENLIPFELQNVRIRYYPNSLAEGYVYGWDFRLNGQFIKDLDSWISLSLMKTEEKVDTFPDYVPRPTDRRINFSLFFQDYIPNNPTIKFYLTLIYNSGFPFGPPTVLKNRTVFRSPAYQRVDVGISKLISFSDKYIGKSKWKIESVWISLEVYNLFGRYNTIGYQWVKDIYNVRFGVPNYLSARLLNLRVIVNL